MQKADADFCKQYDESRAIIRQLETAGIESKLVYGLLLNLSNSTQIIWIWKWKFLPLFEILVAERKDGVLEILLKTEEDVLDDKGLVVALKEAKAKVFEILNDLTLEKKNQRNLEVFVFRYRLFFKEKIFSISIKIIQWNLHKNFLL